MKLVLGMIFLVNSVFAYSAEGGKSEFTFSTREIPLTLQDTRKLHAVSQINAVDPASIIAIIQGLVALGEPLYNLIVKGKPTITTNMNPINVVPRDGARNYVEPMDLEDASDMIKRKYVMTAKNKLGSEVVRFEYVLLYQTASYEGKGKYILNAIILPQVKVGYGFEFNSQMRLVGISNAGKKDNPIVRAILNINYQIGSLTTRVEKNDALVIDGLGNVRLTSN